MPRVYTFGAKICLSTGLLLATMALTVWLALSSLGALNASIENTAGRTSRKIMLAGVMNTSASNMAAGQRGVVLFTYAREPAEVAAAKRSFEQNLASFRQSLTEIRPLLVTERGKEVVSHMESVLATWYPAYAEMAHLAEAGDADGAARLLTGKIRTPYLALGGDCKELSQLAEKVLDWDRARAREQYATARWLMLLLALLSAGSAMASSAILRSTTGTLRLLAEELMEGSRQVASASSQVASASQSLAQGASQQAATLQETSSSTTEITAITRKNSENTRNVTSLVASTTQLVDGANHNLHAMIQSMNEINSSSEKISKIIRVIDEIAFQTNILALNAAVEAARAGEAGMGFAVVADEVRNLAHRSAQAAKDTASLIEESISRSGEGNRKLDQVAQSIRQITAGSAEVRTLVDEIDVGSQEQARGIEQISGAVGQLEQVTQRNAASAEQSAAASEELAAQAESLHATVERLRRLTGGARTPTALRRQPDPAPKSARQTAQPPRHGLVTRTAPSGASKTATVTLDDRASFPLDASEDL